jgi:hypothetical protein
MNMRDHCGRELHLQKQMKSGEPGTKRRKYMYFEQMLLLIPLTQHHIISSNYSPLTGNNGEEGTAEKRKIHKVPVVAQPKLLCVEGNSMKVILLERYIMSSGCWTS